MIAYNSSGLYEDHPLNNATQDIRLMHLYPGTDHQQLYIRLDVKNLNDANAHGYNCISYVWGTDIATEAANTNKGELPITVNLLSCLRHLRHKEETLVLWVDAICINQNDLNEKSDQVALMGEIYSRCSTVYIWLGASLSPYSIICNPFRFIQHFADNKHYSDVFKFLRTESGSISFQADDDFTALWESFLLIAKSPWWTRIWTIQEAFLPGNSALCFGNWRSTFDTLIIARRNRLRHLFNGDQCCKEAPKALPASIKRTIDLFMGQIAWIERFRQAHLADNNPLSTKGQPQVFPDYNHRPFYEVALTFSYRLCSEPRDKIYSLLPLVKRSVIRSYKPDYTTAIAHSFIQAFKLMLEEMGNDYRCMIGPIFGSGKSGLPSWVPDFAEAIPVGIIEQILRRILLSSLFDPSNGENGYPRYQHPKRCFVTGVQADTVISVSPNLESAYISPQRLKSTLRQWRSLCETALGTSKEDIVRIALSHVMCASMTDDGVPLYGPNRGWRRTKENDLPSQEEWQYFMDGNMWSLPEGYRETMHMASSGRSLYITSRGRIGLCYLKVKSNDEVWILIGSKLPFILRKVSRNDSHLRTYHLVGDCFLEGVMDGEVVQATTKRYSIVII